jgi:hypothetical protein
MLLASSHPSRAQGNSSDARNASHPYHSPTLPRRQVAVLTFSHHVYVTAVDGASAEVCRLQGLGHFRHTECQFPGQFGSPNNVRTIELLPGRHMITFQFGDSPHPWRLMVNSVSASPITKEISVDAGKTYEAQSGWRIGKFESKTPTKADNSPPSAGKASVPDPDKYAGPVVPSGHMTYYPIILHNVEMEWWVGITKR